MTAVPTTTQWFDVDPWWDAFGTLRSIVIVDESDLVLDERWAQESVTELGGWWTFHEETLRQHHQTLRRLFAELTELWRAAGTPFESDPLSVDWQSMSPSLGPIRTGQEENWSQWLAHLLRAAPGLASVAFDVEPSFRPTRVHREKQLVGPNGRTRRPDILAHADDTGLHIEVKIEDVHYEKTPHTASLVEHQYPGKQWRHILLLPGRKSEKLVTEFNDDELVTGREDRPVISVDGYPDIAVRYWENVGQALRSLLIVDGEGSDHLRASAFSFCALIEQKILRFTPEPKVEHAIDNVLARLDANLETQVNYLNEFMESVRHE